MFERWDEKARRVIFFARLHAGEDRSAYIRCVHLLAGIAREVPELLREVGLSQKDVKQLRSAEKRARSIAGPASAAVEIPFDEQARRAVVLAGEAADKLGARWVGPPHILLAVARAEPKLKKRLSKLNRSKAALAALSKKYSAPAEPELPKQEPSSAVRLTARAGIGYDLHRMEPGRKLVLGGVEVPFDRGPAGHSDGDVLSHAICDALLGAAGLGDIGAHFPDTDPKWKGVSSLVFLERTRELFDRRGLRIEHIDAVVIAERPRLRPHFPAMRVALAKALRILPEQISLKAKTNEGLGELGRGEAIAAHAVATVEA